MGYDSRTGAVLFAENLERVAAFYSAMLGLDRATHDDGHIVLESAGFQLVVHRVVTSGQGDGIGNPPVRRAAAAFKPVFFVPSISRLRRVAEAHGGVMEAVEREWVFNGVTVCDAVDPEGNVIQFREHAVEPPAVI
jgi:catechol 2,3-dioxygenase-like lactoylglutathione lyase family enzyme